MSDKLSAYRKNYSIQHVLLRLIENWRRCLDENKVVGAVLMDLSKVFDCLSHELLIAKLDAYGFNENTIRLVLLGLGLSDEQETISKSQRFLNSILPGLLKTRWTWGGGFRPPPNSLVFNYRSLKFGR